MNKLPLGSPAWLRAIADDKEETRDAIGSDPDFEREDIREILGLRDAANRIVALEMLVRSACAIAERKGEGTAWNRYLASARELGLNGITARTYRVLSGDPVDP